MRPRRCCNTSTSTPKRCCAERKSEPENFHVAINRRRARRIRALRVRHLAAGALLRVERTGGDFSRQDRQRGRACSVRSALRSICSALRSSLETPITSCSSANSTVGRKRRRWRWCRGLRAKWIDSWRTRWWSRSRRWDMPMRRIACAARSRNGIPTRAGAAVLVVQWECVTNAEAVLVPLRTSRFTAQATKAGNYGDIVRALNQTLADFAAEVAIYAVVGAARQSHLEPESGRQALLVAGASASLSGSSPSRFFRSSSRPASLRSSFFDFFQSCSAISSSRFTTS